MVCVDYVPNCPITDIKIVRDQKALAALQGTHSLVFSDKNIWVLVSKKANSFPLTGI